VNVNASLAPHRLQGRIVDADRRESVLQSFFEDFGDEVLARSKKTHRLNELKQGRREGEM
jgi:hypothetical protein